MTHLKLGGPGRLRNFRSCRRACGGITQLCVLLEFAGAYAMGRDDPNLDHVQQGAQLSRLFGASCGSAAPGAVTAPGVSPRAATVLIAVGACWAKAGACFPGDAPCVQAVSVTRDGGDFLPPCYAIDSVMCLRAGALLGVAAVGAMGTVRRKICRGAPDGVFIVYCSIAELQNIPNTGGSPKGTPYPTGMVEREKKASPPEGIITLTEAGGSNFLDPPRRDVSQRPRTHAELPRCLAACLSTLFPSTRP